MKKVVINGKLYYSFSEASREIGLSAQTIAERAKSERPLFVNWYEYDGEKPTIKNFNLIFEKVLPSERGYAVEGKLYGTKEEVFKKFGIDSLELDFRVKSDIFNDWQEVKIYDEI